MELPLVDVNTDTVSQTWPLLLSTVKNAHFIALDLELSGLGSLLCSRNTHTESRYGDECETVNSRAILSLGVSCFRWRDEPTAHPLSDNMSPPSNLENQSPSKTAVSSPVLTDQTSHTPRGTYIDVRVFNVSLMCQKAYTIDPSSAQFLLKHGFDFNKQVSKGVPYTPGPLHEQPLERECVSIHNLLAAILATGQPIVVHNGWIDLLFLYGNFYAPLPPSLATVTANMSEMFVGGVFDTKAIAKYEVAETATFLEYLFRKCQEDNDALMNRGFPHLQLHMVPLSSSVPCEMAPLYPSHTPSLEEAAEITVCETFSRYGYCRKNDCKDSHNVLVVLLHEHQQLIKYMKRKIKGQEKKMAGMSKPQENHPPPSKKHCSGLSEAQEELTETCLSKATQDSSTNACLLEQFASDLEAARSRLASASSPPEEVAVSTTPVNCNYSSTNVPCDSMACGVDDKPSLDDGTGGTSTLDLKPSFGHRAGFDAFMTGYVFAYYALTRTKARETAESEAPFNEVVIAGLSSMKNRLNNGNRTVPLILAKSQFVKTSQTHRENLSKIAEFKKSFHENPHLSSSK